MGVIEPELKLSFFPSVFTLLLLLSLIREGSVSVRNSLATETFDILIWKCCALFFADPSLVEADSSHDGLNYFSGLLSQDLNLKKVSSALCLVFGAHRNGPDKMIHSRFIVFLCPDVCFCLDNVTVKIVMTDKQVCSGWCKNPSPSQNNSTVSLLSWENYFWNVTATV